MHLEKQSASGALGLHSVTAKHNTRYMVSHLHSYVPPNSTLRLHALCVHHFDGLYTYLRSVREGIAADYVPVTSDLPHAPRDETITRLRFPPPLLLLRSFKASNPITLINVCVSVGGGEGVNTIVVSKRMDGLCSLRVALV